jgi:2-C-methyl-D-erythritol 2,4-cyclodiphosphate synthase
VIRVGIGYDSHRFEGGRALVLGGIVIPHPVGLAGHSDADAIAHAICDAMLGAVALGDIGRLFPDTDPAYHGVDSMQLLATVCTRVSAAGFVLQQADVTVIAEAPKLAPHVPAMESRLAEVIGCARECVSIKAKTNEKMGFIGRGEGVAVLAVATLIAL